MPKPDTTNRCRAADCARRAHYRQRVSLDQARAQRSRRCNVRPQERLCNCLDDAHAPAREQRTLLCLRDTTCAVDTRQSIVCPLCHVAYASHMPKIIAPSLVRAKQSAKAVWWSRRVLPTRYLRTVLKNARAPRGSVPPLFVLPEECSSRGRTVSGNSFYPSAPHDARIGGSAMKPALPSRPPPPYLDEVQLVRPRDGIQQLCAV